MLSLSASILLRHLDPYVLISNRLDFKTFAPELSLHVCVHPELISIRESITCRNRRVMTHLFTEILELRGQQLKGFSENRVKRLVCSLV